MRLNTDVHNAAYSINGIINGTWTRLARKQGLTIYRLDRPQDLGWYSGVSAAKR